MQFLYDRIVRGATLSESNGAPDPPSTLNWMKALALMVQGKGLNFELANNFYIKENIGKGVNLNDAIQNIVMEQLTSYLPHIGTCFQGGYKPVSLH